MFINNWYAACTSEDLDATPRAVRMLGCDFVLFRDPAGAAHCLSDACCHRGASLSAGSCRDGRIACPQHGWEYDPSGRCVRIPAGIPDPSAPPKRARVPAYPVEERFGLVFAFLGDLDSVARPAIPALLPEWADEAGWHRAILSRRTDVNFVRMAENYNDPCHVHYVHEFGRWLPKGVTIQTLEQRETYVKAFHAAWDAQGNISPERGLMMEFDVIGMMSRNTNLQPGYPPTIVLATVTPRDHAETQIFMILLQPKASATPETHRALVAMTRNQVMGEDDAVLKTTRPRRAASPAEELLVETDLTVAQVRQMTRAYAEKHGEIDTTGLEALRDTHIRVIPCPGHRSDPKNWVHRTVPLHPPRARADRQRQAGAS